MVDYNLRANVINPTSFYVEKLQRLGDDINYLKSTLWPLILGLSTSADIEDFSSRFPCTVYGPITEVPKL
jgi:hypothetical protein